jgi:CHAT domain-containing protein/Tfp pilus assembly protein PilF
MTRASDAGRLLASGLVLTRLLAALACTAPGTPERGAVVESVEPWGAAAEAGISPGDTLIAWIGTGGSPARVPIDSPLDVLALERSASPRGPVSVLLRRGSSEMEVKLRRSEWETSMRPALSEWERNRYQETSRLAELERERPADALWLRLQSARALLEAREIEEARRAFAFARERALDDDLRAATFDFEGEALFAVGEYSAAAEAFVEAVRLRESNESQPTALAFSLRELGRARLYLVDLEGAEESLGRSLSLYRAAGPSALESSDVQNLLAGVAYRRGDLEEAETRYQEAAALREPLAPESPRMGALQANLGLVAYDRGDFDVAERYLRRALSIDDRVVRDPRDAGYTLNFLGLLSRDKGDFEAARAYYERALRSFRSANPQGPEVAGMLNNLGNLDRHEGNLASAESHHREALAIRERLPDENLDVAASLHNLASVYRLRGLFEDARPLLSRALEIKERLAPESLLVASTLFEIGEIHRAEGATEEAAKLHRRALAIRRSAAPEGDSTVESLFALGGVAREAGSAREAERLWREAIGLIESRRGRLAFTTAERSRFSARFYELYRELAQLLAENGRAREAFDLVERARAHSLRVMMAQRDFAGSAGVPAELVRERRRLEQALESAESRLTRSSVVRREELAPHHERQRELRRRLDDLNARIRESAPRLSLLEDPAPVPLEAVRRELPAGTLLLSYAVGPRVTLLFSAGPRADGPEVEVEVLPMGEEEIRRRVEVFRALIERGNEVSAVEPALLAQGRRLYELLLLPVEEALAAAERLVVVSEGPLLTLPFETLVREIEPPRYLFQWKPLSHAASAGFLIELQRSRPPEAGRAGTVVAFGDPDLPESARASGIGRLPFAREEAERIGSLFGGRSRVFVGRAASEGRARSIGTDARVIHFATHALPDARFPLESALVLTPGEGAAEEGPADGWLRAWEIAESLRLNADLVTLSGCETGLGRELQGEGILGLARAFQFAGARSVLVSLWAVPDRSTRDLMVRFYEGLDRGLAKDEALREARRELLAAGSHPYHWSGFRILGDFR